MISNDFESSDIYKGFVGNTIYANFGYDKRNFYLNSDFLNYNFLSSFVGGGLEQNYYFDKTQMSATSDITNKGYISQPEIINIVIKYTLDYLRRYPTTISDNWRNNYFNVGKYVYTQQQTYTQQFVVGVSYKLVSGETELVEFQQSTYNNDINFEGLVLNYVTGEIITPINKVYWPTTKINNILNSNNLYLVIDKPEVVGDIIQVDKKFIPLISDIPAVPTTQGTYTLQVVVDQDGNPTFSWISQI